MGCDVHICLERIMLIDNDQSWKNVDYYEFDHWDNKFVPVPVFQNRDYDLFAALADVRNYGLITPLAEPRGIPEDVCEKTKETIDRWGEDGHSHSWCTLAELYTYRKENPTTQQSGLLDPVDAKLLDEKGFLPSSWCMGSTNKSLIKKEWTRLESPVDRLIKAIERRFDFYGEEVTIDMESARKIRIVFFFDN